MNNKKEDICLALGWMYAEACSLMDNGEDIRQKACGDFIDRALEELVGELDHANPRSELYKVPKEAFCEQCRNMKEYSLSKRIKNKNIKEIEIVFEEILTHCNNCGGEVFIHEIRDLNLQKMEEEYNKKTI